MYVQYGCGLSAPEGWRNFDASPSLVLQRIPLVGGVLKKFVVAFPDAVEYGDITKGLPIHDKACRGVYCSHILEHLALADLRSALQETFRILKEDGVFRLVLPDLEHLAKTYISDPSSGAAVEFMRATALGKDVRKRSAIAFLQDWVGNSTHLWMWDYRSLAAELHKTGFRDIRRASISDAADPMFSAVEDESRWANCLGIECRRVS